jgi:hypothetical protein
MTQSLERLIENQFSNQTIRNSGLLADFVINHIAVGVTVNGRCELWFD